MTGHVAQIDIDEVPITVRLTFEQDRLRPAPRDSVDLASRLGPFHPLMQRLAAGLGKAMEQWDQGGGLFVPSRGLTPFS